MKTKAAQAPGIMFGVTCLFWMSQYIHTSYINAELSRVGASAAFIGVVSGMYGLAQTLLRLPLGLAADKLNRQKPFVVLGCLMAGLSGIGMWLWYTPMGFLVFRTLGGVAAAAWVSFTVLYSSYFPPQESPQRLALLNLGNQGGRLAAFVAAVLLTAVADVRATFLACGLIGLAAAVLSLRAQETAARSAQPEPLRTRLAVLKNRNLCIMTTLAVLAQFVAFATVYGFTANLAATLGASAAGLSTLNLCVTIPLMVGNYLAAKRLMVRFGARRLLAAGFVLMTVYCVFAPLVSNVWLLFAMQAVGGVGISFTMGLLLGLCVQTVEMQQRSTAMGFFQALYGVGMTLGPLAMGLLIESFGMTTGFFCMAGVSLASVVLVLIAVPPMRERACAANKQM